MRVSAIDLAPEAEAARRLLAARWKDRTIVTQVRPDIRRVTTLAADLLSAMGKRHDVKGVDELRRALQLP